MAIRSFRLLLHVLSTAALMGCAAPQAPTVEDVDLAGYFSEIEGTGSFVLLHQQSGAIKRYNPERLETRYLPASTFKIPNGLIALETGVADGPDYMIPWDSTSTPRGKYWPASWAQDHTLRTGFANSVVWYYKEIARRIGPIRMQTYLNRFDYGNRTPAPPDEVFWLTGDLRISPMEQVRFLKRFYEEDLGLLPRTTAIMKDIMEMETTETYRISGKTGTVEVTPTRELGWLVGFIEIEADVYFFALNMEGEKVWEASPPHKRLALVKELLATLGLPVG